MVRRQEGEGQDLRMRQDKGQVMVTRQEGGERQDLRIRQDEE